MAGPWERYAPSASEEGPWTKYAPTPKVSTPVAPISRDEFDPAKDMSGFEKALVGAGGGLRNAYLGMKSLVGQGTEEERQERMDWENSKKNLGGWGLAGEIVGEGAATAPIGGIVGAGAKVLTKAVPAAAKLASMG